MNTNPLQHPITEQSVTVEGITSDYVWYHSEVLTQKMDAWKHEFKRVVKVMEDRHNEHLKMIDDLLRENKNLKETLKKKDD
jgi:hypothetical protein